MRAGGMCVSVCLCGLYFSVSFWLIKNFSTESRMREALGNLKDLECCAFLQIIIKLLKGYFYPHCSLFTNTPPKGCSKPSKTGQR